MTSSIRRRIFEAALLSVTATSLRLTGPAHAQTPTGTIVGSVKDESGGAAPGVVVTVTNLGTNRTTRAQTNETGNYVVPLLNPAEYSVSAEKTGFQKAIKSGVVLRIEQRAEVNLTLRPGQVTEVIDVKADVPLLDTSSSSLGQVIDNARVTQLPLNARGVFNLVALSPGVVPDSDVFFRNQADSSIGPSTFKTNGGRALTNETLVDGIPNNGGSFGQVALHPTVDAVQEFKVQTSNYSAEFGNAGGAVVNVILKSGTNQLHGTLWEFLRNDALDANNYFSNRAGIGKGSFRFNQFGGTAGGPVFIPKVYDGHDKSFFFFSYEGTRRVTGRNPSPFPQPNSDRETFPIFATRPEGRC